MSDGPNSQKHRSFTTQLLDSYLHGQTHKVKLKKLFLLLDLDNTLIHCRRDIELNLGGSIPDLLKNARCTRGSHRLPDELFQIDLQRPNKVTSLCVKIRPHARYFLRVLSKMYDIRIVSKGHREYVEQALEILDPSREIFIKDDSICTEDIENTGADKLSGSPFDGKNKYIDQCLKMDGYYTDRSRQEVLIIDDADGIWASQEDQKHLIKVDRYTWLDENKDHLQKIAGGEYVSPRQDCDEQLLYLIEPLREIFQQSTEGDSVIPIPQTLVRCRSEVLTGCVICFSGLRMEHLNDSGSGMLAMCENMGARITSSVEDKELTHLVAKKNTEKVKKVRQDSVERTVHVVYPMWVSACYYMLAHVDPTLFDVKLMTVDDKGIFVPKSTLPGTSMWDFLTSNRRSSLTTVQSNTPNPSKKRGSPMPTAEEEEMPEGAEACDMNMDEGISSEKAEYNSNTRGNNDKRRRLRKVGSNEDEDEDEEDGQDEENRDRSVSKGSQEDETSESSDVNDSLLRKPDDDVGLPSSTTGVRSDSISMRDDEKATQDQDPYSHGSHRVLRNENQEQSAATNSNEFDENMEDEIALALQSELLAEELERRMEEESSLSRESSLSKESPTLDGQDGQDGVAAAAVGGEPLKNGYDMNVKGEKSQALKNVGESNTPLKTNLKHKCDEPNEEDSPPLFPDAPIVASHSKITIPKKKMQHNNNNHNIQMKVLDPPSESSSSSPLLPNRSSARSPLALRRACPDPQSLFPDASNPQTRARSPPLFPDASNPPSSHADRVLKNGEEKCNNNNNNDNNNTSSSSRDMLDDSTPSPTVPSQATSTPLFPDAASTSTAQGEKVNIRTIGADATPASSDTAMPPAPGCEDAPPLSSVSDAVAASSSHTIVEEAIEESGEVTDTSNIPRDDPVRTRNPLPSPDASNPLPSHANVSVVHKNGEEKVDDDNNSRRSRSSERSSPSQPDAAGKVNIHRNPSSSSSPCPTHHSSPKDGQDEGADGCNSSKVIITNNDDDDDVLLLSNPYPSFASSYIPESMSVKTNEEKGEEEGEAIEVIPDEQPGPPSIRDMYKPNADPSPLFPERCPSLSSSSCNNLHRRRAPKTYDEVLSEEDIHKEDESDVEIVRVGPKKKLVRRNSKEVRKVEENDNNDKEDDDEDDETHDDDAPLVSLKYPEDEGSTPPPVTVRKKIVSIGHGSKSSSSSSSSGIEKRMTKKIVVRKGLLIAKKDEKEESSSNAPAGGGLKKKKLSKQVKKDIQTVLEAARTNHAAVKKKKTVLSAAGVLKKAINGDGSENKNAGGSERRGEMDKQLKLRSSPSEGKKSGKKKAAAAESASSEDKSGKKKVTKASSSSSSSSLNSSTKEKPSPSAANGGGTSTAKVKKSVSAAKDKDTSSSTGSSKDSPSSTPSPSTPGKKVSKNKKGEQPTVTVAKIKIKKKTKRGDNIIVIKD